jgi:ribosomal protein S18 acetylase RimI-like enzyme
MHIRQFEDPDWPAVWGILEPIFRAGETYAYPCDISESSAREAWIEKSVATYVAEDEGELLGTYYIVENQPGRGSHVCNCGYAVAAEARGRGIATLMCKDSQEQAVRLGFRAMQYNLVAATNAGAVRLWTKLGFEVAGTLPGAFLHPNEGYVDAYVMYKTLDNR